MSKYEVWPVDDDRDNASTVDSHDCEGAAEEYVRQYEAEDAAYPVAEGGSMVVRVSEQGSEEIVEVEVTGGGFDPIYYANGVG